jgi:hypothetical protein
MMKTLLEVISTDPARDRSSVVRGLLARESEEEPAVDKSGGSRRAGVIRGASLIAKGEALGHGFWIDDEALDSVVEFGNNQTNGVKVRFTHPGMSGDGLGSYLGRAKGLFRDGDNVRAEAINFSPSSRDTPDGDRGGYVMDLADDDPEAFGMSIVFDHDRGAEKEFEGKHSDAEGDFTSPDKSNEANFPHVRFAALHAADFVDEPAANPDGLFHAGPTADILKQAESTLEYSLGLTDELPDSEATGGLSAERLRGFLTRFLESRGLAINLTEKEKGDAMSDDQGGGVVTEDEVASDASEETTETESTDDADTSVETEETTDETNSDDDGLSNETDDSTDDSEEASAGDSISREEFSKFVDKFGAEKAAKYLADGTSFEEALGLELEEANGKLATRDPDRGEDAPVDEYSGDKPGSSLSDKRKNADRRGGFNLPIRGRCFGETANSN